MMTTRYRQFTVLSLGLIIWMLAGIPMIEAKQGPKTTPPGLAKKGGMPPGKAKRQGPDSEKPAEATPGMPPGLAKRQQQSPLPEMLQAKEQMLQAWCLARQGSVNVVFPDKTICSCLTETHAVAFTSDEDWPEAVGKALHHALTTEKNAGIVLLLEDETLAEQTLPLESLITYFELPITVWKIPLKQAQERKTRE
jgi:hypothetical protein